MVSCFSRLSPLSLSWYTLYSLSRLAVVHLDSDPSPDMCVDWEWTCGCCAMLFMPFTFSAVMNTMWHHGRHHGLHHGTRTRPNKKEKKGSSRSRRWLPAHCEISNFRFLPSWQHVCRPPLSSDPVPLYSCLSQCPPMQSGLACPPSCPVLQQLPCKRLRSSRFWPWTSFFYSKLYTAKVDRIYRYPALILNYPKLCLLLIDITVIQKYHFPKN